jgi:hypothetical protein
VSGSQSDDPKASSPCKKSPKTPISTVASAVTCFVGDLVIHALQGNPVVQQLSPAAVKSSLVDPTGRPRERPEPVENAR